MVESENSDAPSRLTFWADLLVEDMVNKDIVTRLSMLASFAPVVAAGVGKHVALSVKCSC